VHLEPYLRQYRAFMGHMTLESLSIEFGRLGSVAYQRECG